MCFFIKNLVYFGNMTLVYLSYTNSEIIEKNVIQVTYISMMKILIHSICCVFVQLYSYASVDYSRQFLSLVEK